VSRIGSSSGRLDVHDTDFGSAVALFGTVDIISTVWTSLKPDAAQVQVSRFGSTEFIEKGRISAALQHFT
jgi:hypothetical protein